MKTDPVTGPLSRDQFRELVDAPFGKATEVIRKYDPLFGRKEGEKFSWKVIASSTSTMVAYVEAENEDEAKKLADELDDDAFDSCNDGDITIESVKPKK